MSTYFYKFCKVLLHYFIIFYFSNYRNHLFMLYFFHEIHPHKHSKNHRGRRACNSLCSGSQAGLCSFCRHRCYSFGAADKKRNPEHSPCPPSCLCTEDFCVQILQSCWKWTQTFEFCPFKFWKSKKYHSFWNRTSFVETGNHIVKTIGFDFFLIFFGFICQN